MYTVPFKDVQTALTAQILERLRKGEALDPAACALYGTLAAHETQIAEKEGDGEQYKGLVELAHDKLVDLFSRADALIKLKREPAPAPAAPPAWQPRTPLERALQALGEAQQAFAKAGSDEARGALAQDVTAAQRDVDEEMRTYLAEQVKIDVLRRLENQLIYELAQQRMHGGSRERIAKLEQQLLETKLDLYSIHREAGTLAIASDVRG